MLQPLQILDIGVGEPLHPDYQIFFWSLMGMNLVLIAVAKNLDHYYFSALFNTAIINRQLLQNTQESLRLSSVSSILMTITYFTNLSMLISFTIHKAYGVFMMSVLGILLAAALIKWAAMWSVMFISERKSGIAEHGMNHLIYYQVTGLILTPVLFFSHFFPVEIYEPIVVGCLLFSGVLLIYRDIQSIGRAFKARVSPLYIILYLCTLEILPLVLIIYVFVNKNNGLN